MLYSVRLIIVEQMCIFKSKIFSYIILILFVWYDNYFDKIFVYSLRFVIIIYYDQEQVFYNIILNFS